MSGPEPPQRRPIVLYERCRSQPPLVTCEQPVYHRRIGLCAAYEKMNLAVIETACVENERLGSFRIFVTTVSDGPFRVGL